ncbi:hypothetical protein HMH01_00085 [Halovulum dunhuangense]|uniref:Uncharacterized protein n=1 Tax=Halovulum dunhuangense TaxID=1505036 RepID=A0A849KTJ2_9RHOB|nr:hypothetical protein [Halovulum dunhuangense]NNU78821.1 hypothetical protein [Halovulum dunhuangense]
MMLLAVLVAGSAAAQQVAGDRDAATEMIRAMEQNCLPKLAADGVFPVLGVRPAEPALASALLPAGDGIVWRTSHPGVVVVSPSAPHACQVLAEGVDRDALSAALAERVASGALVLEGELPLGPRDQRGLYLYAPAADGYVRIHVANLPEGRLGALFTRTEENPAAGSAPSQ